MGIVKRTICMVTNWYPTKENPYQGIFFKEQALALGEAFNFLVVHYYERKNDSVFGYIIRKIRKETISAEKINEEKNIVEFNVITYSPKCLIYIEKILKIMKIHSKVIRTAEERKKMQIQKAFKEHLNEEVDVFYCVDAQYESYILQCAADALGKPYIVSEHAPFPYPGYVISENEKNAIEKSSLFMAISYDKIRQVLMQDVHPKKIAYVGNMVNEEQFSLNKGNNKIKTFIMVAANSFYKNYPLFIDVFNKLTEITEVPFRVIIVGYGANKGYSKNVEELENRIKASKFSQYAELIREVNHDKIQEVYSRADVFVMTSIQEGMPVSALEAGCCGLPIFSTMCGGVEDYINDDIGRIYKIVDSDSFANGLKEYLEGRIIFNREHIRNYIIEKYGKSVFLNRMKQLFNETIDNHSN